MLNKKRLRKFLIILLLIAIIIGAIILIRNTLARYETNATSEKDVDVAFMIVDNTFESNEILIDNIYPADTTYDYTFNVSYFIKNKKAETENSENTENGIEISNDVIAVIAGVAVSEVQGVASMSGGFAGGITEVLSGKKNMAKGIKVDKTENTAKIDVNIIVEYGSRIPDVAFEIQNRVKKSVESMTGFKVEEVNVHVQGVDTNISKSENTDNQKETNENEGEK